MRYRAPVAAGLVLVSSLASVAIVAEGDGTSASASARITLRIAPRTQLLQAEGGSSQQLCLGHIPARHYYLLITERGSDTGERVSGRAGSYCLPTSVTEEAGEVTIVAQ